MYIQEVKGFKSKRFNVGNGFFVEVVETEVSGSEVWIGRDRFGAALYITFDEKLLTERFKSEQDVADWLDMEAVLDIARRKLSYKDEHLVIDGSGIITELIED